jgi:hypothetical protein
MLAIVRLLRPASFDSQMHSATVLFCFHEPQQGHHR